MELDNRIVLMCAMRYALGRKTYVVSSVTSELIKNWSGFSKSDKEVMLKEIRKAIEENKAGMKMDVKRWIAVMNNSLQEA